jgi:hypothetical protein
MRIRDWWHPRALVTILCVGAVFIMVLGPLIDPDVFWHLANGRLILTTGAIPRADPFSFTRAGAPWICHEWLTEVGMYALYNCLGPAALMIIGACVITLSFALVLIRCRVSPYLAAPCTLLAVLASAPVLGVRPQMVSLLLTSVTLYIVEGGAPLWILVPLGALWGNLHGAFFTGPAVVGAYAVGEALDMLALRARHAPQGPSRLRQLALATIGMGLAPLLNPYGLKLYAYPFQTLTSSAMRELITEWQSPNFHKPEFLPLTLLVLALLAVLGLSRKRVALPRLILLLGTAYAALSSARHVPLFALAATPVLVEQAAGLGDMAPKLSRPSPRLLAVAFACATLALLIAGIAWRIRTAAAFNTTAVAARYPVWASEALRQSGSGGNLLNDYDWGGFLIWRGEKVFIDGRADVYGDDFFNQYSRLYRGQVAAEGILSAYDIGRVLIKPYSPLATFLQGSSDWRTLYQDAQAVVFVRADSR